MERFKKLCWTSRLAGMLAICLILFNILPLSVFAEGGWSGNTWEGNTWEGNEWEGHDWDGNDWEGSTHDGGNGHDGPSHEGSNHDGGNGHDGSPHDSNTQNGGNGHNGPSHEGDNRKGDAGDSNNPAEFSGPFDPRLWVSEDNGEMGTYDGVKLAISAPLSTVGASFKLAAKSELSPTNALTRTYTSKFTSLGMPIINMFAKGTLWEPVVEVGSDGYDAYGAVKSVKELRSLAGFGEGAVSAGETVLGQGAKTLSFSAKLAGRFNIGMAVINGVFSGIDTVKNTVASFDSSKTAFERSEAAFDAGGSLGSTLMSAGVVAAAIPGGQAIGLGLGIAGAALWGLSKGAKYVNRLSGGSFGKTLLNWRDKGIGYAKKTFGAIKSFFGG